MATQNFHVEADVDGRSTRLEAGPRSKDGGFTQTVYMRSEGSVQTAVRLTGQAHGDQLTLYVTPGDRSFGTGSNFTDWPESMTIEKYELDGGGFGFRITSKR